MKLDAGGGGRAAQAKSGNFSEIRTPQFFLVSIYVTTYYFCKKAVAIKGCRDW